MKLIYLINIKLFHQVNICSIAFLMHLTENSSHQHESNFLVKNRYKHYHRNMNLILMAKYSKNLKAESSPFTP